MILIAAFLPTDAFAQWNGSSNISGNIYRNGNVGIGESSPNTLLHIKSNVTAPTLNLDGSWTPGFTPVNLKLQTYSSDIEANYFWDITSGPMLKFEYSSDFMNPTTVLEVSSGNLVYHGSKFVIKNSGTNELALYDDGRIHAREIEVNLDVIPDYVFREDYRLMPLEELQKFIKSNHHLPNIKSAKEYEEYGRIPLKELSLKLLEKVEELTLYTLKQEKMIKKQQEAIDKLLLEVKELKNDK